MGKVGNEARKGGKESEQGEFCEEIQDLNFVMKAMGSY